jgi:hypothetical protein
MATITAPPIQPPKRRLPAISHVLALDDSAARCGRRPCRDVVGAVPLVFRKSRGPRSLSARLALAGLATAVLAVVVAPTAWTVATIDSRYGGSAIAPAVGPMTSPGPGGPGGRPANDGQPASGGQVPRAFPTNDQLATLVADGQLRYVLLGGRGGGPGGDGNSNLAVWVKNTCTVVSDATSGVSDLYDCAP